MTASPPDSSHAADFVIGPTLLIAVILLLAAAAIGVIWYGSILRNRRRRAERQVVEDFETAEDHGATTEPKSSVKDGETAMVSADTPEREDAPVSSRDTSSESGNMPAAAPVAAPDQQASPSTAAPAASDIAQIKGLGPKLVALLAERGVTQVAQLAALSPDEAAALDADLGAFKGRMARDRWIDQAKLLNAGDRAGYEKAFGKLGG